MAMELRIVARVTPTSDSEERDMAAYWAIFVNHIRNETVHYGELNIEVTEV